MSTILAPTAPVSPAASDERVSILLVDDEPRNLTVLESILDDPGYRLVRATSGDEALLALVNVEIAVIVLDIHMPGGMSGFELAQMIKRRPKTASIPIIFLTAHYGEDRHVLEGYQTGAVDYLHKPVNAVIFRSKVAVFAELYRKTRESARVNLALTAEVTERRRIQEQMQALHGQLEQRVTERTAELLAANRALEQTQAELQESNERKDQFLAMLGHELRNPLAPIRNAIGIMKRENLDPATLSWCCEVIDRQAEHLTRLVDDLLDVARVARGKIHVERSLFDLAQAIEQGVQIARPLLEARHHELTLDVPRASVFVEGDPTRLAQVVANLVDNAAKYTNEGGRVWVTLAKEPGSPERAVIRVKDNGRGMDAQVLGNLFQLFYQAQTSLDRSDGGLGVGLALVRSLVELHGGSVEATSDGRGSGSEFVVRLPCTSGAAKIPAPVAAAPQSTPSGNGLAEKNSGGGLRVLVVDDNRDAAKSTAKMLQILGHQAVMAYEGHEAVAVALRERPSVVLLDIGLPGLNGYEVCRELRRQGMTGELFVAVTGYGQENDRQLAMEAGFNEHLVKPVRWPIVQQLLGELAKPATS